MPHNTPGLPPKILHNLCFPFLLGIIVYPWETEDKAYAKFWGANKVFNGGRGNGEWNEKKLNQIYTSLVMMRKRRMTNENVNFVKGYGRQ